LYWKKYEINREREKKKKKKKGKGEKIIKKLFAV
jgi:hypothetical protein